jgi:hypothetical protein
MPLINPPPKPRKQKRARPDDVFEAGAIRFERYGRLIVGKNFAPPEYFKEIRKKAPEAISELEEKIRSAISELREVLQNVDPVHFLTNAYGEYFAAHMGRRLINVVGQPVVNCTLNKREPNNDSRASSSALGSIPTSLAISRVRS